MRALAFLNQACSNAPDEQFLPFMIRSRCEIRCGKYVEADADADRVLSMAPGNLKGLVCKAEAQYSLGRFEYGLVFFHRWVHSPITLLLTILEHSSGLGH